MSFAKTASAVAVAFLLCATPALADGLVDNVNGLTVDGTGGLVHFDGLVIDKEGRVVTRLRPGDPRPERPDYRFDGKGRTLIPGFVDAHGHVMELGFSRLTLDLSGTRSLEEARGKIAAYAAANPERPWIIGRGWDETAWDLGRFPTAADLADIAPDKPIWLTRSDGDAGWANAAALKAAGVTAKSKAPAGGRIVLAAGAPSGLLIGTAQTLVEKVLPRPLPKDYDAALQLAQQALLARGVTTIADMGTSIEAWQAYRRAGDRGALRMRILAYTAGLDQAALIAGSAPTPWLYDGRLRAAGVELRIDGTLDTRGAWLKAPYADAPAETGLPRLTGTPLRNQMSRAAMDGFQLAVQAVGDKANAEALDAIESLAETYAGDRRWRIEHAQIIDPADLPRFALYGTIASMQPLGAASQESVAATRLGVDRLAGADAWKAMLANGASLAFGSGVPAHPADPLRGMSAALTRAAAPGTPDPRLTLAEALRAYTLGGAYAGLAETQLGNLAPGQRADFLILDRDISKSAPEALAETGIEELWIGGRRIIERGTTP
ncbi:MAG TPA: amidohydrolase family protein [Sphingobium sp.]|nr:amidohydrolase family protein [Sphingobium sp.]